MCGIIGYTGEENAKDIILDGLKALEYRGYDSAGLAIFSQEKICNIRTQGRVSKLEEKANDRITQESYCGIGHTRWATHGKPSEQNAHPHRSGKVTLVHNGIIENYKELKSGFDENSFYSDTDTEVAAKIIEREYIKAKDPLKALISASELLKGSYALGILFSDLPEKIFAMKKDSPLLAGIGKNGIFIASDSSAFIKHTEEYIRLADGDIAEIEKNSVRIFDCSGKEKKFRTEKINRSTCETDKKGYRHYMLKEIFEQPEKIRKTFFSITNNFQPDFSETIPDGSFFKNIGTVHIVACGTALHSGLIGKYYIEKLARIPVTAQTAGEFRYSEPIIRENDIAIVISQSGETADSLAALRMLNKKGIRTLSIVNTVGSTIAEESARVIYTLAGQETAVASTKAFSVQCEVLLIIALKMALIEKRITEKECQQLLRDFLNIAENSIPAITENIGQYNAAAQILADKQNVFYIGRGCDSFLCSEASLKLKEISYIHSEAYPASELKHGTISLIEDGTPVVAIATQQNFYEKMRSNIEEVKSRGAKIISVCGADADIIKDISDCVIEIPKDNPLLRPFGAAVAVQLLAYYTALGMGRDIDKPRNLAKSVTVE